MIFMYIEFIKIFKVYRYIILKILCYDFIFFFRMLIDDKSLYWGFVILINVFGCDGCYR